MTSVDPTPAVSLLSRLEAAERRLAAHATSGRAKRRSEPDPTTGEQWEAGQVWAHLAEFPGYWLEQARKVLAAPSTGPVPFGRVQTDPNRLAAVENRRYDPPAVLWHRLQSTLTDLRAFLSSLEPAAWAAQGQHPARGVMSVEQIIDEFIVRHLEEHAEQLDRMSA